MTDDPFNPVRRRGDEERQAVLHDLAGHLADDPAYELVGEMESSPWGSGLWLRYTDPDGRVHAMRLLVEPWEASKPPRPELP